jgi:APA family basic amino acid/polyamine antiporter
MPDVWSPKPGDKVFHPRRITGFHLKRVLGVPGLFSAGYGDVGSSIYYALGIVALVALGATPIALGAAGLIYVFNVLTYAEGGAMIPEAGGSASFARHGFNNTIGFIAGWALMLSYIVTMAISAYTIPPYLSHFWPILHNSSVSTTVAIGIIGFLMLINVLGVRESTRLNILFICLDIAVQVAIIVIGVILILSVNPGVLIHNMFGAGNWPSTPNLIMGIAIAALCFTGVETVSQLAEETQKPNERIPHAYILMIIVVLVLFAGISLVALSAMTPQQLGDPINGWARDPIAGIAANLPSETLRSIFEPLVSLLAATILLTATNAGLLGISRLTYNMSSHKQLPSILGKIQSHFRTPYIAITIFCGITILLLLPGYTNPNFFADLGALYVFGSLLCFALAHASILALRINKPDLPRPFKIGWNIHIKGKQLPLSAILGLLTTFGIWMVIMVTQPFSRWAGLVWMAGGLFIFLIVQLFRGRKSEQDEWQIKRIKE